MRACLETYKTYLISSQTELTSVKQNSELIKTEYARHMSSCNACKEKLETDKQVCKDDLMHCLATLTVIQDLLMQLQNLVVLSKILSI